MIIFCLCGIQWNDKEAAPKLQEFNNMRKNQTESHYTFRREFGIDKVSYFKYYVTTKCIHNKW
jgi:hypothetical protein